MNLLSASCFLFWTQFWTFLCGFSEFFPAAPNTATLFTATLYTAIVSLCDNSLQHFLMLNLTIFSVLPITSFYYKIYDGDLLSRFGNHSTWFFPVFFPFLIGITFSRVLFYFFSNSEFLRDLKLRLISDWFSFITGAASSRFITRVYRDCTTNNKHQITPAPNLHAG